MHLLGYLCSVLIGVSLGLIGGGGSILTVPILVYLFQIPPAKATGYSLFVVGLVAILGAYKHYRMGNLQLRTAWYFALPSLLSLYLSRHLLLPALPAELFHIGSHIISKDSFLLMIFAFLMLFASFSMIRKRSDIAHGTVQPFRLGLIGLGVGFVTGLLGAGGGFLIIPALVFFGGLPMKQAVGTSLLIISVNTSFGFMTDLLHGAQLDYPLLAGISLMAIAGMWIGTLLAKRINGAMLQPLFGWVVLIMGTYILLKEWLWHS